MKIINLLYTIMLLAVTGLLGSCEKETSTYEWSNGVHFEVGYREQLSDTSAYSFAYEEADVKKMVATIRIQLEGNIEPFDRKIDLEVVNPEPKYSDYFEFNPDTCYIRGGMSYLDLNIILHRFPDMEDNARQLVLALKENEFFKNTTKTWVNLDKRSIDLIRHKITSSDIIAPPVAWYPLNDWQLGMWSTKKFLLICEVTGFKRKDFQSQSYMGSGRKNYIKDTMNLYFKEYREAHANDPEALKKIQEQDGTYMTMGN